MKRTSHQKGFTIIELLVYISLVSVGVIVMTAFLADVLKSAAHGKMKQDMQQNGRYILSRLIQDIRSKQVDAASDADTLVLASGPVRTTYDLDGQNITYAFDDGAGAVTGPVDLNSSGVCVASVAFTRDVSVRIDMTIRPRGTCGDTKGELVLATTVVPRQSIY